MIAISTEATATSSFARPPIAIGPAGTAASLAGESTVPVGAIVSGGAPSPTENGLVATCVPPVLRLYLRIFGGSVLLFQ